MFPADPDSNIEKIYVFKSALRRVFVEEDAEKSGTFRLLLKPELASADSPELQPYAASPPDQDKAVIIFARDGSDMHNQLEDIIGSLAAKSPGSYRALMATGGIPLVLRISKEGEGEEAKIFINKIIARGWIPRPPDNS